MVCELRVVGSETVECGLEGVEVVFPFRGEEGNARRVVELLRRGVFFRRVERREGEAFLVGWNGGGVDVGGWKVVFVLE